MLAAKRTAWPGTKASALAMQEEQVIEGEKWSLGGIEQRHHAGRALMGMGHALNEHPVGFLLTIRAAGRQPDRQLRVDGPVRGLGKRKKAFRAGRQGRAGLRDAKMTMAVGEKAVVADFDEALRQDMPLQASNELRTGNGQGFFPGMICVVLVIEGDGMGGFVQSADAMIGQADAVSIACEISEHGLRPGEGALGVDDPVFLRCVAQQCGETVRRAPGF